MGWLGEAEMQFIFRDRLNFFLAIGLALAVMSLVAVRLEADEPGQLVRPDGAVELSDLPGQVAPALPPQPVSSEATAAPPITIDPRALPGADGPAGPATDVPIGYEDPGAVEQAKMGSGGGNVSFPPPGPGPDRP